VSQPHGGALFAGGVPGHRGGGGRPPSVLRERLRGSFDQRVRVLEEIADDRCPDPTDRIRAVDVLGRYGLGTVREVTADEVRERLRVTLELIRSALTPALASELISQLRRVWTT
jgi:hypothetical protein